MRRFKLKKFTPSFRDIVYDFLICLYGKQEYTLDDFRNELVAQLKESGAEGNVEVERIADKYIEKLFEAIERKFMVTEITPKTGSIGTELAPANIEKASEEKIVDGLIKITPKKDCPICWGRGKVKLKKNTNGDFTEEPCSCILRKYEKYRMSYFRLKDRLVINEKVKQEIKQEIPLPQQESIEQSLKDKETIDDQKI